MLNTLIEAMETAIQELQERSAKTVLIFHHNDADGLCSGAILTRAFERQGFEVRRVCLEKPYPAVLKKVYEQKATFSSSRILPAGSRQCFPNSTGAEI